MSLKSTKYDHCFFAQLLTSTRTLKTRSFERRRWVRLYKNKRKLYWGVLKFTSVSSGLQDLHPVRLRLIIFRQLTDLPHQLKTLTSLYFKIVYLWKGRFNLLDALTYNLYLRRISQNVPLGWPERRLYGKSWTKIVPYLSYSQYLAPAQLFLLPKLKLITQTVDN